MAKILIVENDPLCRRLLQQALTKSGYETSVAESADRAMEQFRAEPPDAVLLDLEMPGKSGIECLATIRREPKGARTPVVMVTASPRRETVLRVAKFGVQGIIVKDGSLIAPLLKKMQDLFGGTHGVRAAPTSPAKPIPPASADSGRPASGAPKASGPMAHHRSPRHPDKKSAEPNAPAPVPATSSDIEESPAMPIMNAEEGSLSVEEAMAALKLLKPIMPRSQITDRVLGDSNELKAMGPAARQVLQLTGSATASLEQVSKALKQDQALSLRMLKLANSSLFSRGAPIDSVAKAVARIGLGQIRTTVMSMGVLDQFSDVGMIGRSSSDWFWEHSIACGLIASRIAKARGAKPEEADVLFTAGLLHDVGRVLYASKLGAEYTTAIDKAGELELPLEAVESRLLLMNHADLTDVLLRKWNFALDLINPISLHHLSVDNIRRNCPRMVAEVCTLALANRLAHAMALGSSGNDVLYPIEDFVRHLELEPEFLTELYETIPDAALDLRLNMLMHSNNAGKSFFETLRIELGESVHPLNIAMQPTSDAVGILFRRLVDASAGAKPNVAVLRVCNPSERKTVEHALIQSEKDLGIPKLPMLVVGTSRSCLYASAMLRDRQVRQVIIPMQLSRLIRELKLASGVEVETVLKVA